MCDVWISSNDGSHTNKTLRRYSKHASSWDDENLKLPTQRSSRTPVRRAEDVEHRVRRPYDARSYVLHNRVSTSCESFIERVVSALSASDKSRVAVCQSRVDAQPLTCAKRCRDLGAGAISAFRTGIEIHGSTHFTGNEAANNGGKYGFRGC